MVERRPKDDIRTQTNTGEGGTVKKEKRKKNRREETSGWKRRRVEAKRMRECRYREWMLCQQAVKLIESTTWWWWKRHNGHNSRSYQCSILILIIIISTIIIVIMWVEWSKMKREADAERTTSGTERLTSWRSCARDPLLSIEESVEKKWPYEGNAIRRDVLNKKRDMRKASLARRISWQERYRQQYLVGHFAQ